MEYLERSRDDLGEVVRVLDEIYRLGREGGPPFNIALLTVAATLSGQVDYKLMAALYDAAKQAGLETVTRLLLSGMPGQVSFTRRDEQQELTLGHRKWMARLSDRGALERLLSSPEPEVVHNLLDNPRITEQDVVLLAARRPAFAEVQAEIFSSRRWIRRYNVKRALVLNPYTPTDISLRLVGFINHQDLRLIGSSPSLPEALRSAATTLAADKSGVPKGDDA